MAINQIRIGSDISNLASNITGTILKNKSTENIAEADRVSRERIEANKLAVEEELKKLGLQYDELIANLNNASREKIAQFQMAADKYIAWLKENGLSERLDTQLAHDKWLAAFNSDSTYFNNLVQSIVNLVGKTSFDNMGIQNLAGSKILDVLNQLRTTNLSDFLKGVDINGKENLNTEGKTKSFLF